MDEQDYSANDIDAQELARWLEDTQPLYLLDVREPYEVEYAHLSDRRVLYAPLSRLAQQGVTALPEEVSPDGPKVVVFCHHGARSEQVAQWLQQLGKAQVYNLAGGIDAYARLIDRSIPRY
ncbi:MAG: hypothetical protein GYA17_14070 [Chloroflexi bacterium]|nr:rhodanese-like domain-containing protein [Anaerolineaceae bacterium]NMB89480.1 hypothetical protein [Chloroflexota bacterium]